MIKAILLATVVPFMAQHRNITPSNEVTTNFYGSVTGVVTKSYVEGLGISSGNTLHFNGGSATTFVEGTAKLIEFINAGKPIFCLYGGNIWTRCESITPSTVSGVQVYYMSFVCNNPSAYANGVSNPLILTCALFPTLNSHQVFAGTYKLLEDNLSALTNSANFKAAVMSVSEVPKNTLVLADNVIKTIGGTNALPKEINAVSASEFAVPWKQYNGYQRLDTVSYGGKIWVCGQNHYGEEVFNEQGHWIDLVSTRVTDRSWVKWQRKWIDDNYAPRDGDVSFGSLYATSATIGSQGTGTVSANLSGGATIGSGKTLAVQNGATFTIGGSNFNTVVGSAIDAKVLAATNAVVDQVHRITATNGLSAIDGDLGIYDTNGHEYDAQNIQGLHYYLNYDGNGKPYWTANYKGASWDYHFKIQFVSGELWHTECPELSIDRTDMAGEENDATLYFRVPIGVLYKTAMRKPVRHGSVVPNYTKVAGKPLTNDVALGTLTIQGQTYDGTSDKTISIEGMTGNAIVLTNGTAKTKDGTTVQATAVGAISTNQLNSGMTWKNGSSNWMNGSLTVGNTGRLQLNNTAKTWFINPAYVKVGNALTYESAPTLLSWINTNETDPTVPSWAKAATPPEGMTANAVVLTNSLAQTKSGTAVTGENIKYASTGDTTVKGAIENTQAIVQTWESFLDGSNVVFSITNYISGTYVLDTAKLRILEMRDGAYCEVYNSRDEINLHINDFSNSYVRTSISALADAVAEQLANKADKDWGKYTSSGGTAPSNTVYMTAPNTVFAGGMEYERVAVGLGSVAILTTKGAPTYTQGDEGTFKFQDDGGTNYFGFAKSDSYTLGCNTDGITVTANIVTLLYEVTMSGTPCIWYKESLEDNTPWEQLNTPDGNPIPGASKVVTWDDNPDPGTKVCYLNCSEPSGFFKATIEVAGMAKFMTNMPADLQRGIFCTNTVNDTQGIIKPSYNGSQVIWTWSAQ